MLQDSEADTPNLVYTAHLQPGKPGSLYEAKAEGTWPMWKKAIEAKLTALKKAQMWQLVKPPDDANIVGSHWVFQLKHNAEGKIMKYKACLVAQGYMQAFGINYDDTFSPIAKLPSLQIIASLAAQNNWPIQQMDVNSAYLNAPLQECVYMRQPPGFETSDSSVCLLKKCLYRLKQSRREWYKCLSNAFCRFGFNRSTADTAISINILTASLISLQQL